LLSGRLSLGRLAFDRFEVKWFGQFVPMVGFGKNTVTQVVSPDYFFLDSSFVSILMCYGMVLFFVLVTTFFVTAFYAKKRNDYYLVLIISVVAVDCMVEHHMMELWYNPFLLLWLVGAGAEGENKEYVGVIGK